MLTTLVLIAPLALAAGPRDRAEDARDRHEDARDRAEDRADAAHHGGAADRREDVADRREDVADRREDVRDRHDAAPSRYAPPPRYAPAPGRHVPAAYHGPYRGPPRPSVVVVRSAPPRPAPPPAPARAKAPPPVHDFALTLDAVDAATGLANASGEFSLGRRAGWVIEGGLGANQAGALYSVGTEIRTYLTGDFDGGLFLGLGGDFGNAHAFTPTAAGFSVGPSLGAKHTFDVGLTLQAAVGLDGIWTTEYRGVAPTASVGLGWAF